MEETKRLMPGWQVLAIMASIWIVFSYVVWPMLRGPSYERELRTIPDLHMSVDDLYREYQLNDVHADNKYKDKRVLVFGNVSSVTSEPLGLSLKTPGLLSIPIDADIISSERNKVAKLSRNDGVRLICTITKRGIAVHLANCVISL